MTGQPQIDRDDPLIQRIVELRDGGASWNAICRDTGLTGHKSAKMRYYIGTGDTEALDKMRAEAAERNRKKRKERMGMTDQETPEEPQTETTGGNNDSSEENDETEARRVTLSGTLRWLWQLELENEPLECDTDGNVADDALDLSSIVDDWDGLPGEIGTLNAVLSALCANSLTIQDGAYLRLSLDAHKQLGTL